MIPFLFAFSVKWLIEAFTPRRHSAGDFVYTGEPPYDFDHTAYTEPTQYNGQWVRTDADEFTQWDKITQ